MVCLWGLCPAPDPMRREKGKSLGGGGWGSLNSVEKEVTAQTCSEMLSGAKGPWGRVWTHSKSLCAAPFQAPVLCSLSFVPGVGGSTPAAQPVWGG